MTSSVNFIFIHPRSSSVRGLPDSGQNDVAEEYLRSFTAKWDQPTNQFVRDSARHLQDFIKKTIDARCGKFSHNGLPIHLRYVRVSVLHIYDDTLCRDTIQGHLQACFDRTRTATALLLKLEHTGNTRNERYYRECKDMFLSHLKMQRELATKNPLLRDLHHPSDSALEDMAKASAGFEGGSHHIASSRS